MKTAYGIINESDVMHTLRKHQASPFYYGDSLVEMRLVMNYKTFQLAKYFLIANFAIVPYKLL
ncbi:hypothetical protein JBO41_09865 [Enterobacter asburiae]|uniref:hypothetical protein n=1 Tax=Enterobacter asburiae TaxID=61645 RepID=UPI00192BB802|nr:hypothetical protein [Enterobacter asburiae]MBL5912428.1 hypothetical protein [Enterobacter asburiae]MBL5916937.1 hypothetical protein [Enterobacter asburiae]MBL5972167.1 hypothetical protein [Enterobacter asburiae]